MIESKAIEVLSSRAQRFKALGDPTRLRILELLGDRASCVCELQTALDIPANLLSHHLKVLREAGFIRASKRGRWVDYRLNPQVLSELGEALVAADPSFRPPSQASHNELRL